jgi:hypothetical protein
MFYRKLFLWYAATGLFWLGGFIFYSWFHFAQLLPNYYQPSRLTFDTFWVALAGNLFSPSRGLFIFVPVLIFVAYLLVSYWSEVSSYRLAVLALAICVGHLIIISGFPHWWGGFSFGPRFTTGLVPWFVLLGILGVRARLSWYSKHQLAFSLPRRRIESAVGIMLLSFSVLIHARGATSLATWLWNSQPVSIDERPERLWDWRHPQFLATRQD